MSEVNAFLQANGGDEEGLTGEEKEVAKSESEHWPWGETICRGTS
jgi:hypothetical protein